ncbi:zinc ribbon domain-containing protein [Bacillus toyonensis]|uniref:zinc ribbon domain-containing protein n=1 Tax=Bacillus toyonensis TaxID=155322 RepID=UPI000BEF89E0|nr:zinc ribbon domain-containing protein [Bacillus toyonensis]PEK10752.1 zinc ribbon domain-containing protein [Bacillus toyonensis]PEK44724.1 zinc ribbon domain-containing protein [Bacillus toyonensis]PEM48677.1 zinc ribbon domain-containing protein [Bacillus toyonensis]PGA08972.1 zinc ribbon domain-containing protein [Bacillus toyonensis]PGA53647.1 zinc ribbon domain-containing protein [Bacillus toyonensis]
MKCPACHTENAVEAKFCGNCGHSLIEEVVASGVQEENQQSSHAEQAKETRPNETVEQAKRFTSGYFRFFKQAFQAPTAIMQSGNVEVRNGIVSLVLICFLGACIFYRMMSAGAAVTRTLVPEVYTPTFFGESVTVFFFLLILTLFVGFIIFISGKMMKSSFSFLEVFGIWGTIATPVIAILVLTFLFSFLLIFFLPILLSLATTYIGISIIVAILKLDNGGLDLVYTLLIANVFIGIVTFIVLWSYISTVIQAFTQGLTGF